MSSDKNLKYALKLVTKADWITETENSKHRTVMFEIIKATDYYRVGQQPGLVDLASRSTQLAVLKCL